jgi:hypothetical protein
VSEGFAKLFSSILRSSVWQEPASTRLVWITLLAMSDRDGYVGASIPGVATAAGVTLQEAETAINTFLAPDRYSRSKEHEGRRIVEADRGWQLLNYARFRDMRDSEARKAWDRERKRADRSGQERTRVDVPQKSAHVEVEVEVEVDTEAMDGRMDGTSRVCEDRGARATARSTPSEPRPASDFVADALRHLAEGGK